MHREPRQTGLGRRVSCLTFTPTSISSILKGEFAKKAWAIMESKSSDNGWNGPRVRFADFGEKLAARRAELGNPDLPRNTGKRRTASKRALLKAIEDAGGKW